jgi:broad specificity phosphatase PhoE
MTKFVLIKYPQSMLDTIASERTLPPDAQLGLTEEGAGAARLLGDNLVQHVRGRFHIWSSPARRCLEAAEVIAQVLGQRPRTDMRLDERKLFSPGSEITVRDFRQRQERGYLDPSRLQPGEQETPISHRIRVESWLAEIIGSAQSDDVNVVVSHGAVIEHLNSALNGRSPETMATTFTFCAPGHAHLWDAIELPDKRRIWCCLGSNVDMVQPASLQTHLRGLGDLHGLAVDLASDPRFHELTQAGGARPLTGSGASYIR